MEKKAAILKAQDIQIASVYFRKNGDSLLFESYPKRLIYKGRQYVLIEN